MYRKHQQKNQMLFSLVLLGGQTPFWRGGVLPTSKNEISARPKMVDKADLHYPIINLTNSNY